MSRVLPHPGKLIPDPRSLRLAALHRESILHGLLMQVAEDRRVLVRMPAVNRASVGPETRPSSWLNLPWFGSDHRGAGWDFML